MSKLIEVIGQRYRLLEPLGQGGMGVVYRAYDRLTGQTVALKQVTVTPQNLQFASRPASDDHRHLLLSLAQEFKFLASLRHPNIISVFDYGFDVERRPYFTMELLEKVQTLRDAGRNQSIAVQVNLLVQTLQALAYLHRRGILHHDLKPENLLVSRGLVRVLDFGLSVMQDQVRHTDSLGTLLYLAPEVLTEGIYNSASDLYVVGLIGYELLVGRHPFYRGDLDDFFVQLRHATPDLDPLPAALRPVIGTLLAKDPAQRYPTAEQVILALCTAIGQPLPAESVAIRESFLQAATFVGREDEMLALTAALGAAQRGHGSAWLVGGESGVGKSRLLDELRTQALVSGVLVLRGQAVEGGGLPYQLWREPVRRLVLSATLSNLEAGVLKELIPGIAALIGREVADAPILPGEAGQQRLAFTIVELFKRQTKPMVLLLEDLHWSSKSLAILKQLNRIVTGLPLLIVANYRGDEQPHLANKLPGMNEIKLARLTTAQTRDLSRAMLGTAGEQPELVDLLQGETEGNAFFMVEALRALAEAAGGLLAIGHMKLPHTILVGGIQQTLLRRLDRLPTIMRPVLQLAAVAGRQLDLAVIARFADEHLERWLTACADGAILEVYDGFWRFAHDKLREAVLKQIAESNRPTLHRQVAEAIEAVYASEEARTAQAEILLDHWQRAGDAHKEVDYGLIVGKQLVHYANFQRATQILRKTLAAAAQLSTTHVPDGESSIVRQSMELWLRLGAALEAQALYEEASEVCHQGLHLAKTLGDVIGQSDALTRLSMLSWRQGKLSDAVDLLQEALTLVQGLHDQQRMAHLLGALGSVIFEQGELQTGHRYSEEALALYRAINDPRGIASTLNNLGCQFLDLGDHARAADYLEESLALARTINDRSAVVFCLLNLGGNALERGDFLLCNRYTDETLSLAQELNTRHIIPLGLLNLSHSHLCLGDLAVAQRCCTQAIHLWHELEILGDSVLCLQTLSWIAEQQGDYAQAFAYSEQCMEMVQNASNQRDLIWALTTHARSQLGLRNLQQAAKDINAALAIVCQREDPSLLVEALLAGMLLELRSDHFTQAARLAGLLDNEPKLVPVMRIMYFNAMMRELEGHLPSEHLTENLAEGKGLKLSSVAHELLRQSQTNL